MKTGLRSLNTARHVNTANPKTIVYSARPMSHCSKSARPKAVNTARPNSTVVNAVRTNQVNAVKAPACWGHPQKEDQGYVDSGCSRHMTGNMSYFSDFKEFNEGYVTFGRGAKGGKIIRFEDPDYPDKFYKVYVDDTIFGSTKKELCTEFEKLMHDKFQMSSMGELTFFLGLQVKQKEDRIFISQDKYVADILRKFSFTYVRTASTPMDTEKPLLKDSDGDDVDVHLYRSMIGSLMYLTSSRLDIMFEVCACARFQVTPKVSHLHAVKRIFSDYARTRLDMKSTIGGCQFLGDSNEKKLIQMIKIHTDHNVIDLLTKAFDVDRFQHLIASIGLLHL
ncbi:uncharacterized mitochondrial protein-like protein [Tanacetum coccineum]